jgi:2-hydroxychromene-2-carboxylate isomerase
VTAAGSGQDLGRGSNVIETTMYSDPACPWAYSESPALRVIEWRYGEQLRWRLVMIGLTEEASQYEARGYTPLRGAIGQAFFRRRYGMPFSPAPKARLSGTARSCRAVIAAAIDQPGSEWSAFRVLQLANFTTPLILDDDDQLAEALGRGGLDGRAIVSRIDAPDVVEAYQRQREESRTAEGSAAELQGKARITDGPVRFTAPSLTFHRDGLRLVAGGFQPVEAYDVLIANLDPTLECRPAPDTPEPLLEAFPDGLTTQEVAALLTSGNASPDRAAAEAGLLELVATGRAVREPLGDDALWKAA